MCKQRAHSYVTTRVSMRARAHDHARDHAHAHGPLLQGVCNNSQVVHHIHAPGRSGRFGRGFGWSMSTSSVSRLSVSGRINCLISLPRTLMLSTLMGLRLRTTILTARRCVLIAMSTPELV